MIRTLAFVLLATPGWAAEGADWPCIQRLVPHLSLGQVWAGPPPGEADAATRALAATLAQRRTALPEAEAMIDAFARDADPARMAALFGATFDHINQDRDRVLSGITRYARKQAALDATIKQHRHDFAALEAADPPDFDAIDKAEAEIDWSTRIFLDRQQSLTYVCETPVILEQRAFALGRAVAKHLP